MDEEGTVLLNLILFAVVDGLVAAGWSGERIGEFVGDALDRRFDELEGD